MLNGKKKIIRRKVLKTEVTDNQNSSLTSLLHLLLSVFLRLLLMFIVSGWWKYFTITCHCMSIFNPTIIDIHGNRVFTPQK